MGCKVPGFAVADDSAGPPPVGGPSAVFRRTKKTIPGLMQYLESLGYAQQGVPDGINCELRPYQEQALKWCVQTCVCVYERVCMSACV
jgi:hypothetical protein